MSLRARILLLFAAIGLGAVVSIGTGVWFAYHRQTSTEILNALIQGGTVAALGILTLTAWIWFIVDTRVARPIDAIASAIRVRASADVSEEINSPNASYLGDLAAAASFATARLSDARTSLAHAVARETAQLVSDKSKLEHLLGDVPPAVLLCTGRHCLVFYNSVAQHILSGPDVSVWLGRSVFDYIHDDPIRQAHRELIEAEVPDGVVEFLSKARVGGRRLVGRMRLARDNDGDTGAYVMTLRDMTGEFLSCSRRDALLTEIFTGAKPVLSSLHEQLQALDGGAGSLPGGRLQHDLQRLSSTLTGLEARFDTLRTNSWPMVAMDSRHFAHGLRKALAPLGVELDMDVVPLVMHCDAAEITALLRQVVNQGLDAKGGDSITLTIRRRGDGVQIQIAHRGRSLTADEVTILLNGPLAETPDGKTGHSILDAHAAEFEVEEQEGGTVISLRLGPAQPLRLVSDENTHAVVYDFDLLSSIHYDRVADASLDNLTYVVFDTETTGLFPERGDEIVQIAAVRLVNGKRIKGEVFETLVNPGRPIPPSASAIHGVTDAMVADAPDVSIAIAQFHNFAEGAVLVAHNAPFDMEFLRRRERELGIRFVNPVLDTVLLSAVVFGTSENHTLDALAERLSVPLRDQDRHTAMGDAVATAEAFLRLKAILASRGIERFDDVLAEVRRHSRLLEDLNG
ncbi:DNA polymerase III subunit epsilon (plasmid) [Neorhizobium sp. SOG26]|uniref:3'-5' exonuclease n=1 Tax=Neorhizobium sp. SOG26 TaxID=2060726 RepID=UPI000E56C828|nr:3'-5' exonuclease [Neorhizobium sp. SOG26]AXV17503.1 DNA polymerase III subunit epsilon [Neorhizobium sp. SOG26]